MAHKTFVCRNTLNLTFLSHLRVLPIGKRTFYKYIANKTRKKKMCWCCTIHLKSCWTPCFWYGDVRSGSVAVSVYTLAMSICLIIYTINVMAGGDSSQLWLPFFETSLKDSSGLGGPGTTMGSGGFVIIYLFFLLIASIVLGYGVRRDIRAFMLPWMVLIWFAIVFQATFGLWLIFGYYIYLEVIMAALCDFIWMTFNGYCFFVVRSNYRNVKRKQLPDIEYFNEMWTKRIQLTQEWTFMNIEAAKSTKDANINSLKLPSQTTQCNAFYIFCSTWEEW